MEGDCVTNLETKGHSLVTFGYCWGNANNETIAKKWETVAILL